MSNQAGQDVAFDKAKIEERYRKEREKRLRSDGIKQYRTINDDSLQKFLADPWAKKSASRNRVYKNVDVLIVGGGFGGMLVAAHLIEAGVKNFLIMERGTDLGGAWYWNRYPGVACDTEAYIYMPLLEELGVMPTEKYAKGDEIRGYAQNIGRHYGLYAKTIFQADVNKLEWDDEGSRWNATTKRGDQVGARFFVAANGTLHSPKFPSLKGIETFEGCSFHTARWNYDYTGGSVNGDLTKLKGKRVGVIGSGASSIQILPHLAASADQVYLFQRTPSSVLARMDKRTSLAFTTAMMQNPGWQKRRIENFNIIVSGGEQAEDLVQDSWTKTMHNLPHWGGRAGGTDKLEKQMEVQDEADHKMMEQIRARVDEVIDKEETAEKLKPWYKLFCKRPCFNNDYLATFNCENVHLIDTSEHPESQSVDETGLWISGEHYDLDCIVYASGFEFGSDFCSRLGASITGRDGLSLTEKWKEGVSTLHGLYTRDFPNAFIMAMSQSGYTQNNTHALGEQAHHIAYIVGAMTKLSIKTIQPTREAEDDWVETIIRLAKTQYKFVADCTPGYYTGEGADKDMWLRGASYGEGSPAFFKLLENWRKEGNFAGMELEYTDQHGSILTTLCNWGLWVRKMIAFT